MIDEEEFARARVALNEIASRKIQAIRQKEDEKIAQEAERANERLVDQVARAEARQAEEVARPFTNAFENIQRAGSDAFVGLFSGAADAGEATADALRQTFVRLFAELAEMAVLRMVVQPIVRGVGGALGGVLGGGGGGSSSGGGVLGSVAGLLSTVLGGGQSFLGGGGGLMGLLGGGGSAAASAALSLVPITTGPAAAAGMQAVVVGGQVVGLYSAATGMVSIEGGASLASAGVAGGAGGATIGASLAVGGYAAAVIGALINNYSFIAANNGKHLNPGGKIEDAIVKTGVIPIISAIANFNNGDIGAGLLDIFAPTFGNQLNPAYWAGPDHRELFLKRTSNQLNTIIGGTLFQMPGVGIGREIFGPRGRGEFDEIKGDADVQFLVGLVRRRLRQSASGDERGDLRSGDIDRLLNVGLTRGALRGRDPEEIIARLVRQLVGFDASIRQLERSDAFGSELVDKAAQLVRVFARELPPAIDATRVASEALAREGRLTADGLAREAARQSRARAEASGAAIIEGGPTGERLGRLGRRARMVRGTGGKKAREAVTAIVAGLASAEEFAETLRRRMELLRDPAKAADQAFGEVQARLDAISAVRVDNLDELDEVVQSVEQAIDGLGQALTGLFDTARALTADAAERRLRGGIEIAALRGGTDFTGLFDRAIREETLRFFETRTPAAQLGSVDRLAALERERADAAISAVTARGQIAASVRDQLFGLRFQEAETFGGAAALTFLGDALQKALGDFRSSDGEERNDAATRAQQLIQQQLALGGELFGQGSSRFTGLRDAAIAALEEIAGEVGTPEDMAADIRAIREALADRLEQLGTIQQTLLAKQIAAVTRELGERFTPEEIAAGVADANFAALLVNREQLEVAVLMEEHLRVMRNALEGPDGTPPEFPSHTIPDGGPRPGDPPDGGPGGQNRGGGGGAGGERVAHVVLNFYGASSRDEVMAGVEQGLRRAGWGVRVAS